MKKKFCGGHNVLVSFVAHTPISPFFNSFSFFFLCFSSSKRKRTRNHYSLKKITKIKTKNLSFPFRESHQISTFSKIASLIGSKTAIFLPKPRWLPKNIDFWYTCWCSSGFYFAANIRRPNLFFLLDDVSFCNCTQKKKLKN